MGFSLSKDIKFHKKNHQAIDGFLYNLNDY
jgi:hypothetical protein